MTLAFWTILAAAILPVLCAGLSKWGASGYDNASPRAWIEQQSGWRRRADFAQRNHFEAFAPFAAAVLVATYAHANPSTIDALALAFIAFRLGYTAAYVFDQPTLRSLLWSGGFFCVVAQFCIGA